MVLKDAIQWGLGRAWRAPRLVLGLWLLNVLAALPAAYLMNEIIADSIGASRFHESLRDGFDVDWYAEFEMEEAGGSARTLASTFGPSIVGHGALLDNLDDWWSGRLLDTHPGLVALGVAYAVLWAFLLGGVIEVLRRPEGPRVYAGFAAACGATFRRFLGLAVISGVLYLLIFALSASLFGRLEEAMREVTVEGTVFRWSVLIAAFVVLLLHFVRMIFDIAKIAVVQDDAGALRALWTALCYVVSRPLRASAAYGVPTFLALVVAAIYALLAPGVGQSTWWTVLLAFLAGQVYLAAKIGLRVAALASQMRAFQNA